jgi:hypothetical protein
MSDAPPLPDAATFNHPVAEWDAEKVAAWVDSLDIPGVEGALFGAIKVKGTMLLRDDLDHDALAGLGITNKMLRVVFLDHLCALRLWDAEAKEDAECTAKEEEQAKLKAAEKTAASPPPPPYTPLTETALTHHSAAPMCASHTAKDGSVGACDVFTSFAARLGLTPACEHVLQRDGKFHLPSALAAIDALKQRSNTTPSSPPAGGGGGAAAVVAPVSEPWWRPDGAWTRNYADVLRVFFRCECMHVSMFIRVRSICMMHIQMH